jgi:hypothetical protein
LAAMSLHLTQTWGPSGAKRQPIPLLARVAANAAVVAVTDVPTETISVANAQRLTRRLCAEWRVGWSAVMKDQTSRRSLRSAICTRVSTEQGVAKQPQGVGGPIASSRDLSPQD